MGEAYRNKQHNPGGKCAKTVSEIHLCKYDTETIKIIIILKKNKVFLKKRIIPSSK